jgi:hypothetical protein
MTPRNLPLAALAAAALACASAPISPPASGLPKEAIPATFAPLRWSVRPGDVPALFPNREAREGSWTDGGRHVTWTVADVRRVDGIPGTLVADWLEGGDLWRARLSFADPRRDCDPDLADRPRRCEDAGPALAAVYDALQAELARGRGAPVATKGPHGGRGAAWKGTELRLGLSLKPDARGAWAVEATVMPAAAASAAAAP